MLQKVKIEFPEKLSGLFQPKRYKILYGGRGGGKSWGVARALLVLGSKKKIRILCAREFQNSISDSVHKLLSDQIHEMELEDFYEILQTSIKGKNGTEFLFSGIRHNASKLKSFEAIDIAWLEEAQNVSKSSWEILIPTIRAEGSEIWVTFNPEFEEDETYQRFVKNSPANALVLKVNWDDNPWFPEVLKQEMEALRLRDEDAYLNIWEGHCRQILEGAVYAKELRDAQVFEHIKKVPYLPTVPVSVFADIGWADSTSLWFMQKVGFEYRALRSYQNSQQPWHHYLQYIQAQGYILDTIWLPHDARAKSLGTGISIEELTRKAGYKVRIVPQLSIEDGINAVRTIFPLIYFDEDNCEDGLRSLRRYHYEVDTSSGEFSRRPKHDAASHAADGLRYFAVSTSEKPEKNLPKPKTIQLSRHGLGNTAAWMK